MMKNASFACPNPSCGKVFANPLKAEVHGSTKTKSYDACPYCLTDITLMSPDSESDEKELHDQSEFNTERFAREQPKQEVSIEKPFQNSVQVTGCKHSFGYLSKRPANEKIPEECITCENIVQCMLKTITG